MLFTSLNQHSNSSTHTHIHTHTHTHTHRYASRLYCDDERPWCDVNTYSLPLRLISNVLFDVPIGMYSWIQREYWGNGLFSYWTWKQIPNFLLASPMILISCNAMMMKHVLVDKTRKSFLYQCFRMHWILLFIIAFLTMNIQVTTRFLSACPSLYWYLARTFLSTRKSRYWIVAYSICYMFLGTWCVRAYIFISRKIT